MVAARCGARALAGLVRYAGLTTFGHAGGSDNGLSGHCSRGYLELERAVIGSHGIVLKEQVIWLLLSSPSIAHTVEPLMKGKQLFVLPAAMLWKVAKRSLPTQRPCRDIPSR